MKYPKAFQEYWKRTYNPDLRATPKHAAYKAWKAGRKFQQSKSQRTELPLRWSGYHYGY